MQIDNYLSNVCIYFNVNYIMWIMLVDFGTLQLAIIHYQLNHDKSLHDIKSLHNQFYYSQVYSHAVIPVTAPSIVEVEAKVIILGDLDHPSIT